MSSIVEWPRLLFALVVAPLCTPACLLVWGFLVNGFNTEHGGKELIRGEFSRFVAYGLAALVVTILLGIPAFLLYRRLKITSWSAYALGGAIVSQIAAIILAVTGTLYFLTGQPEKPHAWLDATPAFLLCGISSAIVFRWIIRPQEG